MHPYVIALIAEAQRADRLHEARNLRRWPRTRRPHTRRPSWPPALRPSWPHRRSEPMAEVSPVPDVVRERAYCHRAAARAA